LTQWIFISEIIADMLLHKLFYESMIFNLHHAIAEAEAGSENGHPDMPVGGDGLSWSGESGKKYFQNSDMRADKTDTTSLRVGLCQFCQ
jgi:hypothetical protein